MFSTFILILFLCLFWQPLLLIFGALAAIFTGIIFWRRRRDRNADSYPR